MHGEESTHRVVKGAGRTSVLDGERTNVNKFWLFRLPSAKALREARRTERRSRLRVIVKSSDFIFDFVEIQPSVFWSGTAALKILIENETPLEMASGTSSLAIKESSLAIGRAKS